MAAGLLLTCATTLHVLRVTIHSCTLSFKYNDWTVAECPYEYPLECELWNIQKIKDHTRKKRPRNPLLY